MNTITAMLSGFNHFLARVGAMLGGVPTTIFFIIFRALILLGAILSTLFVFLTLFDEVGVVLFIASVEQHTLPRQMWADIRAQIKPTILVVATILTYILVLFLAAIELLRHRLKKLRNVAPN